MSNILALIYIEIIDMENLHRVLRVVLQYNRYPPQSFE